jgi:uncharacterized protein with PIN domain
MSRRQLASDCLRYAAALTLGEPLLSKGDDFIHTDVPLLDVGNAL